MAKTNKGKKLEQGLAAKLTGRKSKAAKVTPAKVLAVPAPVKGTVLTADEVSALLARLPAEVRKTAQELFLDEPQRLSDLLLSRKELTPTETANLLRSRQALIDSTQLPSEGQSGVRAATEQISKAPAAKTFANQDIAELEDRLRSMFKDKLGFTQADIDKLMAEMVKPGSRTANGMFQFARTGERRNEPAIRRVLNALQEAEDVSITDADLFLTNVNRRLSSAEGFTDFMTTVAGDAETISPANVRAFAVTQLREKHGILADKELLSQLETALPDDFGDIPRARAKNHISNLVKGAKSLREPGLQHKELLVQTRLERMSETAKQLATETARGSQKYNIFERQQVIPQGETRLNQASLRQLERIERAAAAAEAEAGQAAALRTKLAERLRPKAMLSDAGPRPIKGLLPGATYKYQTEAEKAVRLQNLGRRYMGITGEEAYRQFARTVGDANRAVLESTLDELIGPGAGAQFRTSKASVGRGGGLASRFTQFATDPAAYAVEQKLASRLPPRVEVAAPVATEGVGFVKFLKTALKHTLANPTKGLLTGTLAWEGAMAGLQGTSIGSEILARKIFGDPEERAGRLRRAAAPDPSVVAKMILAEQQVEAYSNLKNAALTGQIRFMPPAVLARIMDPAGAAPTPKPAATQPSTGTPGSVLH